jgi:hypothetical protein
MTLLSWLWPRAHPDTSEVEKMEKTIEANARAIEGTEPLVEESTRRLDDSTYHLRATTNKANRRIAREGALLQDLGEGWGRRSHG